MSSVIRRLTALCIVATACACAQTTGPAHTTVAADGETMLTCREMPQPGSNAMRTVCATEDEWRRIQRDQRAAAAETLRRITETSGVAAAR